MNDHYVTNSSRIVDFKNDLFMHLVLEAGIDSLYSSVYITPLRSIILDGDSLSQDRINNWESVEKSEPVIHWYKILPEKLDTIYENKYNSLMPWARIKYHEELIPEWDNKWSVNLTSLENYESIDFPGTIRFKAEVAYQNQYTASAGVEKHFMTSSGNYGGLTDEVMRISVKGYSGNVFLDNVLLFRNLPLIINPGSWNNTWDEHQTVKWIGGNVTSYIIRAAELAGRSHERDIQNFPFPQLNFFEITDYYAKIVYLSEDLYLKPDYSTISLSNRTFYTGDFIIKDDNICLLYKDRSPKESHYKGYANRKLDNADLVITWKDGRLLLEPLGTVLGDGLMLIKWKNRWRAK